MKDYMIKLIALLLGCEQNSGSGYLASVSSYAIKYYFVIVMRREVCIDHIKAMH